MASLAGTGRFFRSELLLIFGRRRNWLGLAILAVVPVIIAVAAKVNAPGEDEGGFFGGITTNGLFVALAALSVELGFFLPLAISTIAGDAVAGEANQGTLRYLLTVPVHRTRLIAVKFAALVVFAATAVLTVVGTGMIAGLLLFGGGKMTLLSGTEIGFWGGLGRVAMVSGYAAVCLSALAAIGLFVSTLTEQPIGAGIAVLILYIVSQILDTIPQLSAIGPYLPTHYWFAFGDLLRDPVSFNSAGPGLLSAGIYTLIFTTAAWARFATKDVTS
ncbi:ABC transporter permease [Longispora albida]|uniref:ABC transporter permease n=1 Tax=Longispora albida TaxID=203523 RepID=UPI0003765A72|nr:ABC transporter permease [Longispora albida]